MKRVEVLPLVLVGDRLLGGEQREAWFKLDDGSVRRVKIPAPEIDEALTWLSDMDMLRTLIDVSPEVEKPDADINRMLFEASLGNAAAVQALQKLGDRAFGWKANWYTTDAATAVAFKLRFGGAV